MANNDTVQYPELLHSDPHLLVSIFIHYSMFNTQLKIFKCTEGLHC